MVSFFYEVNFFILEKRKWKEKKVEFLFSFLYSNGTEVSVAKHFIQENWVGLIGPEGVG